MLSQPTDRRACCRSLVVTATAAIAVILASSTAEIAQRHLDVVHEFAVAPGISGPASLIQATDGNFYGTTEFGLNSGTLFKMTPAGILTVLHEFTRNKTDGANPGAPLIQAADGDFYGTTIVGGASDVGTVFKMTATGTVTVLHAFARTDGSFPRAALIQAADGNFYGTTPSGGAEGAGVAFMMTPAGVLTVLHSFSGTDELGTPTSGLIQATDGSFYGTAFLGSTFGSLDDGKASVFRMTAAGSVTVLSTVTTHNGPATGLIQATDGSLYGAIQDGVSSSGLLFKVTLAGVVTTLHSFNGAMGSPSAPLLQLTDGPLAPPRSLEAVGPHVFKMAPNGTSPRYTPSAILNPWPVGSGDRRNLRDGSIWRPRSQRQSIFTITPGGAFTIVRGLGAPTRRQACRR